MVPFFYPYVYYNTIFNLRKDANDRHIRICKHGAES